MAFGVFVHRTDSIYNDYPSERYQFPKNYLERAKACEGDWIVYYEPTKVANSKGYFAVAKVQQVIPDPNQEGMFIAVIEPGTYLDFGEQVNFKEQGKYVESGLLNEQGRLSGRAQAAIRTLPKSDFARIIEIGLSNEEAILPRSEAQDHASHLAEAQTEFEIPTERQRVEQITNRTVRDRNFRKSVLKAYDNRCAVSGLKLINGGGRAEVEAAHIRPVKDHGPDIVPNGLALSGTAHWMFDRGLLSLSNEGQILVSRHINNTEEVDRLLVGDKRARLPANPADCPHPVYLDWHRTECFKR